MKCFHSFRHQLQLRQWRYLWKGWVELIQQLRLASIQKIFSSQMFFVLFVFLSSSKPCTWALQQVWRRWSCITVRLMGKSALSAAWPETLTVHGTDRPVHGLFLTASAATEGRTSFMETLFCSVWIRIWAVRALYLSWLSDFLVYLCKLGNLIVLARLSVSAEKILFRLKSWFSPN